MANNFKIKFRRDRYYKARGGTAQLLRITCGRCGRYICLYQKDGSGNLYRIYWDRVFEPAVCTEYRPDATQGEMAPLGCPACGYILGVPMTYAPEARLAWRLAPGAVHKTRLRI